MGASGVLLVPLALRWLQSGIPHLLYNCHYDDPNWLAGAA